jgi:Domain of unknown function (DUF397)
MTDSATWRKSSYSGSSGGNCVEVGSWRKSSYSGGSGGDCVEIAGTARVVTVRDTKDRDGGMLAFTADAWATFTASLKH